MLAQDAIDMLMLVLASLVSCFMLVQNSGLGGQGCKPSNWTFCWQALLCVPQHHPDTKVQRNIGDNVNSGHVEEIARELVIDGSCSCDGALIC